MDFGSLLDYAKQNDKPTKEVKCYRTTFAPPKKEQRTKTLSVNIQKFLARKEEEEKLKVVEATKKREELLALRAQDSKANKRVRAMLKSTKAANKAVIDDARDDVNTAVTMAGPSQPDEDDYGYVSQEASAFYNKLMDKYSSTPGDDPKFSKKSHVVKDLTSTKDRVRMALLKEEEEESMGHKRRRRRTKDEMREKTDDENICYDAPDRGVSEREAGRSHGYSSQERSEPEVKKKKRPPAPPPMDFAQLLKVAAQKQFEPVKIEKKESKDEEERPMTKKQKEEFLREKHYRQKKEEMARLAALKPKEKQQPHDADSRTNSAPKIPRIPKVNGARPAQESNNRMDGQEYEPKVKGREPQPTRGHERSPADIEKPIDPGRSNHMKTASRVGDQELRSNDGRRDTSQTFHKGKDVYSERKPVPVQNVPSAREKRGPIEEKKLGRDPLKPSRNEERQQLQSPPQRDGRSQSGQSSRSDIRDERSSSNPFPKPVINDEKRLPSQSGRLATKEERRIAPSENTKGLVKAAKTAANVGDTRRDQVHQRVNENLKATSSPARKYDDRISKNVPLQSGSSMLKDRLTGPNNNVIHKTEPSGDQQARKDIRSHPNIRNQNSSGSAPNRNQKTSNSDPIRNQNSSGSVPNRNLNSSGSASIRNQNSSGSVPNRNQNSSGSAPIRNQNSSGSVPNRNLNSSGSAPIRNQNSSGSVQNRNQNSSGSVPNRNQNSSGSVQNRNQNSSGSVPNRNQNSSGSVPNRNQNSSGSVPNRNQNSSGSVPNRNQNSSGSVPNRNKNSSGSVPDRNQGLSSANATSRQPLPKDKFDRNSAGRPQAMCSQGPYREGDRGPPPDRRREMVAKQEMRKPPAKLDRGPPGGRFLPASRPGPQGMRRPLAKRRIESDDEYDSELDDFIDDGPEEGEDYSKYIKEIFGYDKARYSQFEDDDECMESNFAQQMKEEFVSTKLGIMEDLEDIKKEQMEKKKKMMAMKKRKL